METKAQRGCHVSRLHSTCRSQDLKLFTLPMPPLESSAGNPAVIQHLKLCWEGQAKAMSYSGKQAPYQFLLHLRQRKPKKCRILSWCLTHPMTCLGERCFCYESIEAKAETSLAVLINRGEIHVIKCCIENNLLLNISPKTV